MSRENLAEIGMALGAGFLAYKISASAFSKRSRQEIISRDGACTVCGATDHLEAAHIDHSKNSNYDNPNNGRALCPTDHMIDHIERHGRNGLSKRQNAWAIEQIKKRLP